MWHSLQPLRAPSVCGLCFRDRGEPKACIPVHLGVSPAEAAEAAHAGDEEEEVGGGREPVRVADIGVLSTSPWVQVRRQIPCHWLPM